jgi:hypothetical protein
MLVSVAWRQLSRRFCRFYGKQEFCFTSLRCTRLLHGSSSKLDVGEGVVVGFPADDNWVS